MRCYTLILIAIVIVLIILCCNTIKSNFGNTPSIPKDIYICYKTIDALPKRVAQRWKDMNPEYNVYVYGDKECIEFLEKNYPPKYADFFKKIKYGPIKADFWRLCILYKNGGIYVDADAVPIVPLRDFLEDGISFCTSLAYTFNLNPMFIASEPKNELVKNMLDRMISKNPKSGYWNLSVTGIAMKSFKELFKLNPRKYGSALYERNGKLYQMLEETNDVHRWSWHNYYISYKGKKVIKNRDDKYDINRHKFT